MKHLIALTILLVLLGLSQQSCNREGGRGIFCLKPNARIVSKTIYPAEFSSVRMIHPASVVLQHSNEFRMDVEGDENILDNIDYKIQDGELKIQFDRCVRNLNNPPKITLSAPYFDGYYLMSSGSLYMPDTFKQTGSFTLDISGSGEINCVVSVDELRTKISGTGSIRVSGRTNTQTLNNNGSGDLDCLGLLSNRAEVNLIGSGNANLSVKDYLKVKISGSGNVNYFGSPTIEKEVTGSGKITQLN